MMECTLVTSNFSYIWCKPHTNCITLKWRNEELIWWARTLIISYCWDDHYVYFIIYPGVVNTQMYWYFNWYIPSVDIHVETPRKHLCYLSYNSKLYMIYIHFHRMLCFSCCEIMITSHIEYQNSWTLYKWQNCEHHDSLDNVTNDN